MAIDPVIHEEMIILLTKEKELNKALEGVTGDLTAVLPDYNALKAKFAALHEKVTALQATDAQIRFDIDQLKQEKTKLKQKQRLAAGRGTQSVAHANKLLGDFAEMGIKPDPTADQVKELDLDAELAALKARLK